MLLQFFVSDQVQGLAQTLRVIAAFQDLTGGSGVRHLLRLDIIFKPDLSGIQAQLLGDQIHHSLQDENHGGLPDSSVLNRWASIGHYGLKLGSGCLNGVAADQGSEFNESINAGSVDKRTVIFDVLQAEPQDPSILLHGQFDLKLRVWGMTGQQVRRSCLYPLDGFVHFPGQEGQHRNVGPQDQLDPKGTPDIGDDDSQLICRNA